MITATSEQFPRADIGMNGEGAKPQSRPKKTKLQDRCQMKNAVYQLLKNHYSKLLTVFSAGGWRWGGSILNFPNIFVMSKWWISLI